MIIRKDTTNMANLQHPSPVKRSSISGENYRNLLTDFPSPSSRPRRLNSSLVRRSSIREMVAPRRRRASKEIVRRALTPPVRKLTKRWLDFRPTPSRLSVIFNSSAEFDIFLRLIPIKRSSPASAIVVAVAGDFSPSRTGLTDQFDLVISFKLGF
ncbi:hypothetical protein L6452_00348 [Arctium lappa]|uniref:Uncharacterized protein n=1 Tax=Arctium lappa TaxID=4217 RepID=A0ACB9FDL2_ARCLA|nr:hypothetical protein L6452_00348 [Arctium lappa]